MKDVTSPQKIAKKSRQIYRKEFQKEAREYAQYQAKLIKPRPKWIPRSVYMWMLSLFIRIK